MSRTRGKRDKGGREIEGRGGGDRNIVSCDSGSLPRCYLSFKGALC